tara:strand:+ start:2523 stop:3698 length:1176 start_codon:yes stop_codon:yes gene_type:complete
MMHVLQFASWYPQNEVDVSGSFFQEFAKNLLDLGLNIGVLHAKFVDGVFNRNGGRSESAVFTNEDGLIVGRSTTRIRIPGPARRIAALERRDVRLRLQAGRILYDEYVAEHGIPDIIHAQACFWGGVIASKIANEEGVPLVVSAHSSVFGRGLVGRREWGLASSVWKGSEQNISVSRTNAKIICDMFNLPENAFQIVPNGIDSGQFTVTPTPSGPYKWICIGNLVENKRVDLLIDAMKKMPSEHNLVIIGDGPMRAKLTQQATELGDRVEFLGTVERGRVSQLLSQCHALVHPSEFETFGVVLVEAMMCGRPVVAMRCGGPEEIIGPDRGLLVENGNLGGLIDAMLITSERGWSAQTIANQARDLFDQRVVCERFQKIYSDVITRYDRRNG